MNALETKVLELIGENTSSPDVFVDTDAGMAPVRDSINEAIAEIVMVTGGYKRQYLLPLRSTTGFYRLSPSNGSVGWISDAWLVTPKYRLQQTDLIRLGNHDARWMAASGSPNSYFPIGQDVIGFYPKPASDSDVIELTLVEIPSAYTTDRQRIKVRDAYQYATVNYAVADFWASRGDAAEANKYFGLYLDAMGLADMRVGVSEEKRGWKTSKEPWPIST